MKTRIPQLCACVISAGISQANADIFTWIANSGMWENPAMWNGPVGQYPDSILDTATINGSTKSATLGQNLSLGTLNVLNGASVYSAGNSIFVNGDTIINGTGSSVSVSVTPSLRDFDTDTLILDNNGILTMYDGLAQFDEALLINDGAVLGAGTIEMNSTTGNLVLSEGGLWISTGVGPHDTLLITRTESSTSKLDWTSPDSGIIVWDGKTIHNELPYTGSLGGRISVSAYDGTVRFISDHGFIANPSSELNFSNGNQQSNARIEAPFIDSYGLINVDGYGVIDSPIVALRGEVEFEADALLNITSTLLNLHSINVTSSGDNAIWQLTTSSSGTMSFKDGHSSIVMGPGSRFDLDGYGDSTGGDSTVNIENDATVWIEAEYLDFATHSPFNGTLNIDGALHLEPVNGASMLVNAGEINLDSGELTGRGIINDGVIRGTGSIEGYTTNNGKIIADGGTLQFGYVNMDGNDDPETGVLRAQTGDLVMNMQSNGSSQYFNGTIFVGNGVGIREVLNADVDLILRDTNGVRGSMELDSGFVVLHDFLSYGDVTINGDSMLRVTGINGAHRISFVTGSVTTINGTLEADGNTWFVDGAQVNGAGNLDIVSTNKGVYFQNNADLGDVSLLSSGGIYLTDFFQSFASVHALTMRDTASLNISIYYSDFQQQILADKLMVQDHAILDGDLILSNFPEGNLPAGETVTILEASSIEGQFDDIDYSNLGPNRRAFVTITDTTVEVFVTCSADLNADGGADFFDVSMFMAQFNSNDMAADLNEDGDLDFFDISIFLSAFDAGC